MDNDPLRAGVTQELEKLRARGEVAAYYWKKSGGRSTVQVTIIGPRSKEVDRFLQSRGELVESRQQSAAYYFLGGELRPGTGIIRRAGGRPGGPGGTLTCFLSSRDSQDLYFAAAGHVVTNFWKTLLPDPDGSIYLNRKGYPGTNSMRFLGNLAHHSDPPKRLDREDPDPKHTSPHLDIAVVKMEGKFDLRQRTTCYGHFGEWPSYPEDVREGDPVMKCGAEETHWTAAVVEEVGRRVWVYGPDRAIYELENQVILKSLAMESVSNPEREARLSLPVQKSPEDRPAFRSCRQVPGLPNNSPDTPFAVAGDSGTLVVNQESKRPVGMLIAGSILDGRYVMTPILSLWNYWKDRKFVLLRA